MVIDYGSGEVEVLVTPWTLVIYEQEFQSDMVQDVLGKVVVRNEESEEGAITVFDYRDVNWTSYIKALWACMKAADDSLPCFKQWSKGIDGINILDVSQQLTPAIEEGLFRSGGTAS